MKSRVKGRAAVKRRVGPPKVKKVVIDHDAVLHVEVPPTMIAAVIPGPAPHVMRIAPIPADKAKPQSWMDFFFGPEKK